VSVRKALLCTLGPSSLRRDVIADLAAAGVSGFRINMSHTRIEELDPIIRFIQECANVPIWIDTEGAQIRTGTLADGFSVTEGSRLRLVSDGGGDGPTTVPITPGDVLQRLEPSARMSIDFDSVVLRVDRVGDGEAEATVLTGGRIGSHKAVTVLPSPQLPPFSDKDLKAVRCALALGIRQFALSFCEDAAAVNRLRELVGPERTIVAKIESREGVRNLSRIAQFADGILIDRGDLSREVRLEAIPLLQKAIIHKANAIGIPVYVATNLLESMVARRAPTRAEVNDVMNTLLDGADGLVLAAETAIGQYPVEATRMINALLREYEGSLDGYRIEDLLGDHPLALDRASRSRGRRRSNETWSDEPTVASAPPEGSHGLTEPSPGPTRSSTTGPQPAQARSSD
jgi:pyruvate kinase